MEWGAGKARRRRVFGSHNRGRGPRGEVTAAAATASRLLAQNVTTTTASSATRSRYTTHGRALNAPLAFHSGLFPRLILPFLYFHPPLAMKPGKMHIHWTFPLPQTFSHIKVSTFFLSTATPLLRVCYLPLKSAFCSTYFSHRFAVFCFRRWKTTKNNPSVLFAFIFYDDEMRRIRDGRIRDSYISGSEPIELYNCVETCVFP